MTPSLDTPKGRFYKAPLRWAALVLGLWPLAVRADMVNGVQLPDGAQKVAENRYRAAKSYEDTAQYYKTVYPPGSYPRREIVSQPGVKAFHISNPTGKGFEGLNIYETPEEVRIFIVPLDGAKVAKKIEATKPVKTGKKKGR